MAFTLKTTLEDDWPESIESHVCGRDKLASERTFQQPLLFCPTRSPLSVPSCVALTQDSVQVTQAGLERDLRSSATARTHAGTYARNSWGTRPARKLLCASALCNLLCASCAAQSALCKLLCASYAAEVDLCKLLCARCSAQVARRKLLCASVLMEVALRELLYGACALLASCSAQVALRKLLCASCSAQVLPNLRDCALRTRFVLKICDFAAGAAGLYSAYFCTENFRFFGAAGLRTLLLYLKFAIFQLELQECTPHSTFLLKTYDFAAGAAGMYSAY